MFEIPENEMLKSEWEKHWNEFHSVNNQIRVLEEKMKAIIARGEDLKLRERQYQIHVVNEAFGTDLEVNGIYWITQEMIDSIYPTKRYINKPCWARLSYKHFGKHIQFRAVENESRWLSISASLLVGMRKLDNHHD